MAQQILTPGYVRWDGLKYVTDPISPADRTGPPGPAGAPGSQGPPGPGGGSELIAAVNVLIPASEVDNQLDVNTVSPLPTGNYRLSWYIEQSTAGSPTGFRQLNVLWVGALGVQTGSLNGQVRTLPYSALDVLREGAGEGFGPVTANSGSIVFRWVTGDPDFDHPIIEWPAPNSGYPSFTPVTPYNRNCMLYAWLEQFV